VIAAARGQSAGTSSAQLNERSGIPISRIAEAIAMTGGQSGWSVE
jgi:hypothetical protein